PDGGADGGALVAALARRVAVERLHRGVDKRPKAPGLEPGIRRFESCRPCQGHAAPSAGLGCKTPHGLRLVHNPCPPADPRAAAGMKTMQEDRNLLIFSGNANRPLADSICRQLGVRPGKALVSTFSDGEVQVEIEENVRRQEVFVIQPTCAPAAENLMELLVLIDALKRASAASVNAVVPYFGYARHDRRLRSSRVPITAKVAAKMFTAVGTDRVLTVDLHADQIQGFFDIPVENVYASPLLLADIWRAYGTEKLIVVSPDVGGVVRARAVAKRLDDADLAIID